MANAPIGKKRPAGSRPPVRPPARTQPRAQPPRRPNAAQARADAASRKRTRVIYATAASALVVVLVIVLIVVKVAGGSSKSTNVSSGAGTPTPASVTDQLASIPASQLAQALQAAGSSVPPPSKINGAPLGGAGKPPGVLYIGAGYCPYCAAERWAMVTALLKFGTFTGLNNSHSSSTDINPNTPTFNFHGSTYSSPYLTFTAVETTTSDPNVPLDTPTPAQEALIQQYTQGTIPFVYFDGRYV